MTHLRHFPITLLCLALMLVLSFFNPPQTPLDNVAMIDKWTHLVMYGGTIGVFWLEYWRATRRHRLVLTSARLVLLSLIIPIALGGVIELLQEYCTGGRRSGEWLDWAADSIGVLLACALGPTLLKAIARHIWR